MADRSEVKRGQFIVASGGAAETDPRKVKIRKGAFMVCDGPRTPLPDDLKHFQQASDACDRIARLEREHGNSIQEIARRLSKIREGLETVRKAKK